MMKDYYKAAIGKLFDNLNRFLLVIWFGLVIVKIFVTNFWVDLIHILLLGLIIFRLFDKNIGRRDKWNNKYLKIRNKLLKPFDVIGKNIKDWDNYVYRKCRHCKTILKLPLPNKRGFLSSKCPHCGKKRRMFVLRKVKIEVIKRGK